MEDTKYYFCEECCNYWEDKTQLLQDVECPNCNEYFLDGNITEVDQEEYSEVQRYES